MAVGIYSDSHRHPSCTCPPWSTSPIVVYMQHVVFTMVCVHAVHTYLPPWVYNTETAAA